jgi:hypothetical protein
MHDGRGCGRGREVCFPGASYSHGTANDVVRDETMNYTTTLKICRAVSSGFVGAVSLGAAPFPKIHESDPDQKKLEIFLITLRSQASRGIFCALRGCGDSNPQPPIHV